MSTPFDRRLLWVHWKGDVVRENSIEALADAIRRETPNVAGVLLKTSNGSQWQGELDGKAALAVRGPDAIRQWVEVLAARDLETHAWCVLRGADIDQESRRVVQACNVAGVRSMLLDVESGPDYFGGRPASAARNLITRIRAGIHPDFHLGLNFDARGSHPAAIHIEEWLPHVQSLHPMVYHWEFGGGEHGPDAYLNDTFGRLVRYGLPVVPMLQTYPAPRAVPEAEILKASSYAFAKGAVGLTYFRYGGNSSAAPALSAIRQVNPVREPPSSTPAKRLFQVLATRLRVRSAPSLNAPTLDLLDTGIQLEMEAVSRTEADGYVWWHSPQGWVAQGRIDNRQVLLIEMTPGVPPYGQVLLDPLSPPDGGPDVPQKRFRVLPNRLNVRTQPDLGREFLIPDAQLQRDAEIIVDADAWTEANGFVWWFHGPGWSAEKSLDSGMVFLDDLTPEVPRIERPPVPAPEPEPEPEPGPQPEPPPVVPMKRFRVLANRLNIRSEPGLGRRDVVGTLFQNDEVALRADAWRELDGYVWWQHGRGWSAERSLDGSQRFLLDLTPEVPRVDPNAPSPGPAPTPPPAPLPPEQQHFQVVALRLNIRAEPGTSGQRLGWLDQGDVLILSNDPTDLVVADNHVWRRHNLGWSAERTLDGHLEYMLNLDTLPLRNALIQRQPVRISQTDWVQYYGNTSFAFRFGRQHSYHEFSQGLHSGLDYGKFENNPANPPVFAAVDGLFDGRGKKYGPNRVDVLVDDYRIIYGHLGQPANLARRQPVTPDAVMGVIENTQIHTHIEVRYKNRYIINPLLLMPQSLADEFISAFPPSDTEFVETGSWKRWLTPLDQPIIRLAGEIIGPTA
jgi:hypothetical protein